MEFRFTLYQSKFSCRIEPKEVTITGRDNMEPVNLDTHLLVSTTRLHESKTRRGLLSLQGRKHALQGLSQGLPCVSYRFSSRMFATLPVSTITLHAMLSSLTEANGGPAFTQVTLIQSSEQM